MSTTKLLNLPEYQEMIKSILKARGFDEETVSEKFMLLLEEIGELASAARKLSGIKTDKTSKIHQLEDEAADVFILLIDLCNSLDVELASAVEAKMAKDSKRIWQ